MLKLTCAATERSRGAWAIIGFVFLCMLLASPVVSQETAEKPKEAPAAETAVVPSAQIVDSAQKTSERLRDYRRSFSPGTISAAIDTQVVALSREIEELKEKTAIWIAADLSLNALEELEREWARLDGKLASWNRQIDSRVVPLQKQLADIAVERGKWRNTLAAAAGTGLSQSIVDNINAVLEDLEETQKLIETRIESISAVQGNIRDNRAKTSESLRAISEVIQRVRSSILVSTEPPLWKAFQRPTGADSYSRQFSESWQWVVTSFDHFLELYRERIAWHVALFVLLLVIVAAMRTRSAKWELDATSQQTVDHVFKTPVSAALLITLLLTRVLYRDAPSVVYEIAALGTVPVLALFVPRLLPREFLRSVYALLVWVLFFPLLDLLAVGNLPARMITLALSALAFVILTRWSMGKGPGSKLARPAARALTLAVSRVGAALMLVSFLANIFGLAQLADLLFSGTLASVYTAILIFVSTRIIGVFLTVAINSNSLQSFASVRGNRYQLQTRARTIISLLGITAWTAITLRWFGVLGIVTTTASNWLSTRWNIGSMSLSVGSIVAFVVALWASVFVSRFVRTVLREDVLPRARLGRGMPETISLIVNYAIIALGFFVALAAAGIEMSEFAIVFGAFGVGIGFGLQTIVNNFISGLILIFERPIQVGDTVELGPGGLLGVVRNIGIRASTIRTFSGAEVIVPNGDLLSGQVTNWTLSDIYRRIDVLIGVAYGTDPHQVIALLLDVAKKTDGVLQDPESTVIFKGFGDSSLDFELRAWTASEKWYALKSDLTVNVHDAIVAAGIHIPFPQRDLHLRSVDPNAGGALHGASNQQPENTPPDSEAPQGK